MVFDKPIEMFRTFSASNNITTVRVAEKTRAFINIIKGRRDGEYVTERVRIDSGIVQYHENWKAAHTFLVKRAMPRILRAESILKDEKEGFAYIKTLIPPKEGLYCIKTLIPPKEDNHAQS